jgi:uncharacterized LabA/DUF88 family protein
MVSSFEHTKIEEKGLKQKDWDVSVLLDMFTAQYRKKGCVSKSHHAPNILPE